ncbi:hypothetical protein T4A_9121 [Trichinella pseudospiralis]|uniref:Uncharacterized protein n=1 Tax=Trichinella pseudospiralis TaxID=6337 RepID=A0A0V1ECG3_TRIPS|nr:hypothetical protein T4A_9121 [Trichinella pseudospiralis]
MIPLLTNPTWSSLLRNNAVLAFCYVCEHEPFTLNFGNSYLLHPTYLHLPEFDQSRQLTNERS